MALFSLLAVPLVYLSSLILLQTAKRNQVLNTLVGSLSNYTIQFILLHNKAPLSST